VLLQTAAVWLGCEGAAGHTGLRRQLSAAAAPGGAEANITHTGSSRTTRAAAAAGREPWLVLVLVLVLVLLCCCYYCCFAGQQAGCSDAHKPCQIISHSSCSHLTMHQQSGLSGREVYATYKRYDCNGGYRR
jgi:hypothetical protein